jgi:hypothetical protein
MMTNEDELKTSISKFYHALNSLFEGETRAMKNAWSHKDDIVYMGPDGLYLIGWAEISAMWDKVGALKLGGKVEIVQPNTIVASYMSILTCIENGENLSNGKLQRVNIRSSTSFRKEQKISRKLSRIRQTY